MCLVFAIRDSCLIKYLINLRDIFCSVSLYRGVFPKGGVGLTTKGPWIFILIVQINCFHLHTNRWSENKDVASSFLLLFSFFLFFFWPEKPHRCYGKQFFFPLFFSNFKRKEKGAKSHMQMPPNLKCSPLGAVKRCLRVI